MNIGKPVALFAALAFTAVAQTPSVVDGGVINAASFAKQQAVAPGGLVAIFGSDLASGLQQADTVPLSTSMLDVQVTFNGVPAPLHFVSSGQINAQVPWNVLPAGVGAGAANVVVTRSNVSSAGTMVQITQAAPGIFSFPPGVGWAIAINPDGTLAAPVGAINGYATRPAKIGDYIQVLGTGFGAVDSPVQNGANSKDKIRNVLLPPSVFIGGQPAPLLFAGLTPDFPGVNQLNVTIPSVTPGDKLPLQVQVNGIMTTDQVVMAVAAP